MSKFGIALTCAGIATAFGLTACGAPKYHANEVGTTAPASSSSLLAPGSSGLVLKIGNADAMTFPVTCQKRAGLTVASGSLGTQTVNWTVAGAAPAAVYTAIGPAGTVFYQARNGMIDSTGKPAGKITVSGSGSTYEGDLTFVSVTVPADGKKAPPSGSNVSTGHYTLTCNAYSTPTVTATSSMGAGKSK